MLRHPQLRANPAPPTVCVCVTLAVSKLLPQPSDKTDEAAVSLHLTLPIREEPLPSKNPGKEDGSCRAGTHLPGGAGQPPQRSEQLGEEALQTSGAEVRTGGGHSWRPATGHSSSYLPSSVGRGFLPPMILIRTCQIRVTGSSNLPGTFPVPAPKV